MKTLRDYQQSAVDSVIPYWESEGDAPLIVVPTGGGKSLIQAALIQLFLSYDPECRFLCLAHRAELIRQNAAEFLELCPDIYTGIYSASLGIKQPNRPVTFAQIQSYAKHIHKYETPNIIIIDECHLMPPDGEGQYRETIRMARIMNPNVKIIGLTATHYRLGSGYLHTGEGALFDGIAYEIDIRTLLDAGHLVPMTAKSGAAQVDLSRVHHKGGEFVAGELEEAFNIPEITRIACDEIIQKGADRKAWLIFSSGVAHAEAVNQYLTAQGIDSHVITGNTPKNERDSIIERFKVYGGCIINCDVLTTGFNAPICDLIALLRATESTGLYVQILGRGMRTHPNKSDCLILDFGGNVLRHGCIDDVRIKDPKEKGDPGDAPAKLCPVCSLLLHMAVRVCPECEFQFPEPEIQHEETAYQGEVLSFMKPIEPWITEHVRFVYARRHCKKEKPDSVCVTYVLGNLLEVSEWICLNHEGYARKKALQWCKELGIVADTTDELLEIELPQIVEIEYRKEGEYYRVKKRTVGTYRSRTSADEDYEAEWGEAAPF